MVSGELLLRFPVRLRRLRADDDVCNGVITVDGTEGSGADPAISAAPLAVRLDWPEVKLVGSEKKLG